MIPSFSFDELLHTRAMTDQPKKADAKNDRYRDTVFLPKTDFPMKAGLPEREPKILERWKNMGLFKRLREQSAEREKFILHDGPPYANGNIHIGHALNKILKDIVVRSRQMAGFDSHYIPGWDCHGLPIEWKIEEQYRAKGKNKDAVPVNEFRKECRDFAAGWIDVQREEFKRLGVEGEWDNPYTTMNFESEAVIARELMKFAETGQLYRGSKPVMWSVVEKTALAEAEVEYQDYTSDAIYVKFPIVSYPNNAELFDQGTQSFVHGRPEDAFVLIWTTTPWTIPGNRAISFSSKIDYGLFEVVEAAAGNWAKIGERYVFASALEESLAKALKVSQFKKVATLSRTAMSQMICSHPLNPVSPMTLDVQSGFAGGVASYKDKFGGLYRELENSLLENEDGSVATSEWDIRPPYSFAVPLLDGDHVTDDAGTGFVHTAPGHGADDYIIWTKYQKELKERGIDTHIPTTVDADGFLTKEAPGLTGKRVITDKGEKGDANEAVIAALKETGNIVGRERLKHQYPHSWRSKKPIIFRNTPQWFISMGDGQQNSLRDKALTAIEATEFFPASGQNRLRGMIEQRPDWVISRQRAWGVPIAVFVEKSTGKILNDSKVNQRIYEAFGEEGADAWFADGAAQRFLAPEYNADDFEQIRDILDVWFDSGCTHAFTLEGRSMQWPADMYLEGSDQHRGWFHSSLLESCGTRGVAPYKQVLTHGFIMGEDGKKMSKSLGNVVAPQDVIKNSGADILRLWVSSSDYSDDISIGPEIIKSNIEAYRKLRNTFRYMLGATDEMQDWERVAVADMPELERYILHKLWETDQAVHAAYQVYDYKKIFAVLTQFMNTDLSAFYFDIRKDTLYCDPWSSVKRRSCRMVIDQLFHCLTTWWAPILAFTMEEVWTTRFPAELSSVHMMPFARALPEWRDDDIAKRWDMIRNVRSTVTGALEVQRANKVIGSSLEAAPDVYVKADADTMKALRSVDLAEICITSDLTLHEGDGPQDAFRADNVAVVFKKAEGAKCARSWKISKDIGSDKDFPDITPRDAEAVREWQTRFGKSV
jgi:isoleucyl-tRNA synthetase